MKPSTILVALGVAGVAYWLYCQSKKPVSATVAPPNSGASTTPAALPPKNTSPSQTTGLTTITPGLAGYEDFPRYGELGIAAPIPTLVA